MGTRGWVIPRTSLKRDYIEKVNFEEAVKVVRCPQHWPVSPSDTVVSFLSCVPTNHIGKPTNLRDKGMITATNSGFFLVITQLLQQPELF